MSPQEIEKLLGGYATDTLTEEERRTLFEAALGNQALFDALADEQALRDVMADPSSRAHLLAALRQERSTPLGWFAAWWRRPSVIAAAAAVAAGIVTVAVVIPRRTAMQKPAAVAMNAPLQQPEPQASQAPAPKPRSAPAPAAISPPRAVTTRHEQPEKTARAAPEARTMHTMSEPDRDVPSATAALPPPPQMPANMIAPAASQFTPSPEVQKLQAQLADAVAKPQALSARALYYGLQQSGAAGGAQPKIAEEKRQSFGALSMRRAAGPRLTIVPGVRYTILRRNPEGAFVEANASTIFVPGDALRVRFETNQAGYLAVMENHGGQWTPRVGTRTEPGTPVYMPAEGTIDVTAAVPRFFVRFSRSDRGEPRPDQLIPTLGLLREIAANSVYVVNPTGVPDSTVDFELTINSR
jgi:hypothetical protein